MNVLRLALLLFGLLLMLSGTAIAQKDTIYSTNDFTIHFPGSPVYTTAYEDSLYTTTYLFQDSLGIIYSVNERLRTSEDTPTSTYEGEQMMLQYATTANITKEREYRINRHKALRFSARDHLYSYRYLIVLTRSKYFRVIVYGPSESFDVKNADAFIDAFELKQR